MLIMRYVSSINKSDKITFYFTVFLIYPQSFINEYHSIMKNANFYLM